MKSSTSMATKKMLLGLLYSSGVLGLSIVMSACSNGKSNVVNPNAPVLTVYPSSTIPQSVITCQQEDLDAGLALFLSSLAIADINESGNLLINANEEGTVDGIIACHQWSYINSNRLITPTFIDRYNSAESTYTENSKGFSISKNGIVAGMIGSFGSVASNYAAIALNNTYQQLPINGGYFNSESKNIALNNISENGLFAVGYYISFNDPMNHYSGGSHAFAYHYDVNSATIKLSNINTFSPDVIVTDTYLNAVSNQDVSVGGALVESDGALIEVGLICVQDNCEISSSPDRDEAYAVDTSMTDISNNGEYIIGNSTYYYNRSEATADFASAGI